MSVAAIVEPAVVEAVAPAIRIPERGASRNAGIFIKLRIFIRSN